MRVDFVERRFAALFSRYIRVVAAHPAPFLIVPIVLTLLLSTGLSQHSKAFLKDDLELYTPTDARARKELRQLDRLFHIDDHDPFYASRRYDIKRAGYIIVTSENADGDILNPTALRAAMQLWGIIQSMTVENGQSALNYPSICVKFPMPREFESALSKFIFTKNQTNDQICVSNPLVELFKMALFADGSLLNRTVDEETIGQIAEAFSVGSAGISHLLGGIQLDSHRRVSGAKAIMLPYALRHSTDEEDQLAEKWELKLVDVLLDFESPWIRTSWWTYETLAAESARDRQQLIDMLAPCFFAVSVYTIAVCCVRSWIRSRPLLALGGVLNAAMAIVSAVGLLLLVGFRMTSVAYSMPFIIFSVGVDNVFILLSAWRITNPADSVVDRLSATFGDAAVSITVTSLTDLISFGVGCLTPFPSVQMFCVYAVAAVLFTYFYQITFFAAVLVLTSRREAEGRHCLSFRPLEAPLRSFPATVYPPPRYSPTRLPHHSPSFDREESFRKNIALSRFFRTSYVDFLLQPTVRAFILFTLALYLGAATYGCMNIKLGLEPNDLLPEDSYGKRTLKITEKYFSDYGSFLHVWMHNLGDLRLGYRRLWTVLDDEIRLYEHTEFTGSSDSWIRSFMEFVQRQERGYLTASSFVPFLRDHFLSRPQYAKYKRDIRFSHNGTKLEASRVTIHLRNVGSSNQSRAMRLFRRLADTSEIPTGVYADFFLFAEQYNAVLPGTLSSVGIAGVAVIAVSLLLIPEPLAAFWVSLSIVSINVGILGFMTFWSVRLDFISMVTIVMSIGFCVDFAAHLAYNFAKGEGFSSTERVRNALYAVGTPILQSASSTILGVSFMYTTESYVFRSFLKTILLVIVLGVLHGLVILPVLLTIFHCKDEKKEREAERQKRRAQWSSGPPPPLPPNPYNVVGNSALSSILEDLIFRERKPPISSYVPSSSGRTSSTELWSVRQQQPPPLPPRTSPYAVSPRFPPIAAFADENPVEYGFLTVERDVVRPMMRI